MSPEVAAFLETYPGDVNTPMELQVDEAGLAQMFGSQYGDIITFPLKDGQPQHGTANGFFGYAIHPDQKYVLVRPKGVALPERPAISRFL